MNTFKHRLLFSALAAAAIIPIERRQPTPCQLQQAGPPSTPSETIDALSQNLSDMNDLADQYIDFVQKADGIQAALKQQIADLVAGDTALAAKIADAWQKSEDAENKLRAGLPGVPPVGGEPLLNSYDDRAAFDSAVAAYTGAEQVTLDGSEVKAGSTPALEYFTHSDGEPAGVINTTGPTS